MIVIVRDPFSKTDPEVFSMGISRRHDPGNAWSINTQSTVTASMFSQSKSS